MKRPDWRQPIVSGLWVLSLHLVFYGLWCALRIVRQIAAHGEAHWIEIVDPQDLNFAMQAGLLALLAVGWSWRREGFPGAVVALVLGVCWMLLGAWICHILVPRQSLKHYTLLYDLSNQAQTPQLRAGEFITFDNYSVMIGAIDEETGLCHNIRIYDHGEIGRDNMLSADSGFVALDYRRNLLRMKLFGGMTLTEEAIQGNRDMGNRRAMRFYFDSLTTHYQVTLSQKPTDPALFSNHHLTSTTPEILHNLDSMSLDNQALLREADSLDALAGDLPLSERTPEQMSKSNSAKVIRAIANAREGHLFKPRSEVARRTASTVSAFCILLLMLALIWRAQRWRGREVALLLVATLLLQIGFSALLGRMVSKEGEDQAVLWAFFVGPATWLMAAVVACVKPAAKKPQGRSTSASSA
jgi:lipopolysaccharide export LptBFGC system permease protein LptF